MAYNKGLNQTDKDRINQGMRDMLTQGKTKEEALAWRNAQVEAAKANVPVDQTEAPQGQASTELASGDGSSDSQESENMGQFSGRAGKKRDRVDEDGEIINLAKDFGEVGAFVESIPFFGDLVDDIYGAAKQGYAQGQTVDDALALFGAGKDVDEETLQKYIAAVENQQNQPVSKEMEDFNQIYEESGGGALGFIKAIAHNPSVAATTITSSMVAMLNPASAAAAGAGAATGAGAGAAFFGVGAGVGAVSGAFAGAGSILETGSSFTEFLQEEIKDKGLEGLTEENIMSVLEDEDALLRIRGKSAARGGIIGLIDGFTGGIAGKAAKGVASTAKRAAKFKSVLAATAVEGAGGGIGETAARLAVGQELDAREIGLEIVGEFGVGVGIAKAARTQPAYEINGQRVNKKQVDALVASSPELAASVKVDNDAATKEVVDKAVSDVEGINNNRDLLDSNENEIRDNKLTEIRSLLNDANRTTDPAEKSEFNELAKEARKELKQIVKEQDKKVATLSTEDRETLIYANTGISKNQAFIQQQSKKYEGQEMPPHVKTAIEKKQEINLELEKEIGVVRENQNIKLQEQEAKKQAKAEEQAVEEAAEEQGITPEQVAAIQEQKDEVINEDVTDNQKKTDDLVANAINLDSAIEITDSDGSISQAHADNYIPLSKSSSGFTKGDFSKEVKSTQPVDPVTAKRNKIELEQEVKKAGFIPEFRFVTTPDGLMAIEGTITSPKRDTSLAEQFQPETPEAVAEGEAVVEGEEAAAERTPLDYVKDFAPEAQETALPGGELFIPGGEGISAKEAGAYRAVGGLKKRGHKDARFDEAGGGFIITPGERTVEKDTPEYSLDEFYSSEFDRNKLTSTDPKYLQNQINDDELSMLQYPRHTWYSGKSFDAKKFKAESKNLERIAKKYGLDVDDVEVMVGGDLETAVREKFGYSKKEWRKTKTGKTENQEIDDLLSEIDKDLAPPDVDFNIDEVAQDKSPDAPVNFTQHQDLRAVAGNRMKLNIGLENNPIGDINALTEKLSEDPRVRLGSSEQVNGEYNGQPERTVVIDAKFDGSAKDFRAYIEKLNADLTQEAIGAEFNGRGSLIYDPAYKGEKYNFDPQFFLKPTKTVKSPAATTGVTERRSEEIQQEVAPRAKSTSPEVVERIARIKPPSIRVEGERGPQRTREGGFIQETTPAPRGEDVIRGEEGRFTEESPTKAKGLDALKGKINDDVIKKFNEGNKSEALVASIPYVRALANSNKRNRDAALDPEIESVALAAATEAFLEGKFQGRKFAPENGGDAIKLLGGIVKDAVRDFYLNEGAPAGIKKLTKDATTRLNKINSAVSRLGTKDPVKIADALNKGFTSIQEKRLPGQILTGAGKKGDTAKYFGPEQVGKDVGQKRSKSRLVQDENITPQQVNDLLAKQEGLTPQRIDVTPFDKIAEDVNEGLAAGTGSVADVLGVNLDNLAESNRDIAAKLNPKEVRAKLDDIIDAITGDPTTKKKIKRYVDREVLSQAQKARALKEFAAKLLKAEKEVPGKQVTPSQELDFNIEEGEATRVTDLGRKSKKQVNSHNQDWDTTAKELNESIRNTDFDNDWVQWSPGKLDPTSEKAKRMDPRRVRELISQPARVYKMASKQGLELRKDQKNPGLYHIYKPGKIGSKPDFNLTENQAANTKADDKFISAVTEKLNQAWPDHEVIYDPFRWTAKIQDLKLNGVSVPWSRMKGFVTGNKVYLSPDKVGYDTPIHEFGHVWSRQLMRENPQLWKKGKELLKGSEYAKAVYSIPTYKAYLKDNPSKFWEEVMANAIGKRGAVLFSEKSKAGTWDKWMSKVGDWVKSKLSIASKNDYADLTLNDWLDVAVQGTISGVVPVKPTDSNIDYNISEDPSLDSDVAAARLAGKKAEGKWYTKPFKWLIPPAADDYHGLVSKLKGIPGIKSVTDAFIKNHHNYVNRATEVRSAVAKASKGIKLNAKDVVTLKGNKLSAAQAIQAHVDGFPNEFSQKPHIQKYINTMTELGVLKKSKDGYDLASPQADLVRYIVDDLYKESFQDYNGKRGEVFTPEVMEKITAQHGKKYAEALSAALQRMATGKNPGASTRLTQKWNDWALGSVGVTMFLNFRSAALQMLSVGNYGFHTKNPGTFFASFADPSTFAEAKKLFNSAYLKERRARAGFDVNAAEMMTALQNSKSFSDFTKKILNKGFIATSAVDSMAIALGGAAFIKAQTKAGVSRAEAIKQWKEQTEEAQQSSRPDRVSQWQTEGISKYVLAFANTPQQYFRLSQKALREIRAGKNVSGNLAKIGYYMAIQNAIFTSLQAASMALMNGIGDEDEREEEVSMINSMLDTVLRGMGIYGAVASTIKNIGFEGWKQQKKARPDHVATALKASTISPPLNRKINDLLSIGRGYNYDSDDKHVNALARGTAFATNLPADWIHKKVKAVGNLQEEQYSAFEKLFMLMGWSEYNFKDDDKDDFSFDFDDVDFDFDDADFDKEFDF